MRKKVDGQGLLSDANTATVRKSTPGPGPVGGRLDFSFSVRQHRIDVTTVCTSSPTEAAKYIRQGELSAFPTETVYGLGADALRVDAVEKIFTAKGRPSDNPLIVHVAALALVESLVAEVPAPARGLMHRFWPGPLTVILPKSDGVPDVVTAGLSTVGLRWPRHPVAQAFLEACETPVAAPSANRSGRPSPTTWQAVKQDLDGRIACILKGGRTEAGVESTVVDCTATPPTVLRPGAISVEALREQIGEVRVGADESDDAPRSPGTRHRHYAPRASVVLVSDSGEAAAGAHAAYIGRDRPGDSQLFSQVLVANTLEEYAEELFHFFRTADRAGAEVIYAQIVPEEGMGRALNDRLRRAAAR
jgi:L-threonylcarbamoyladenylate synthase